MKYLQIKYRTEIRAVPLRALLSDINPLWDLRYTLWERYFPTESDMPFGRYGDLYHIATEQGEVISHLSENENISRLQRQAYRQNNKI